MRRGAPLTLLSVLIWAGTAAAEVVPLADLEARALESRTDLRASRADVDEAQAGVEAANSAYYPVVTAAIEATATPGGELVTVDRDGTELVVSGTRTISEGGAFIPRPRVTMGASARGLLYDFGRTASTIRAAESRAEAASALVRSESREIREQVRATYLNWIAAHTIAREAAAAARAAEGRRQRVEGLIAEGARPAADKAEAVAAEAAAKLGAVRAEGALERSRRDLADAVGAALPPGAEPDLTMLEKPPGDASEGVSAVAEALERQRAAALATADRFENRHRPVLSAGIQVGVRAQQTSVFPAYEAGVQMAVPLWDGGAEAAQAAAARAQAEAYGARAAAARAQIERAEAASREAFLRAENEIELATTLVNAAESRLRLAEDRYEQGAGSLEAIADARGSLLDARTELVQAQLHRAAVRLGVPAP
jgi:outer membrane protein